MFLISALSEDVAKEHWDVRQSIHGGVEMVSNHPSSHISSHHLKVVEMLGILIVI